MKQHTLIKSVTLKGVGLHTGKKCTATFNPAPENHGITFSRVDLPNKPCFKATIENVVDIIRGTTLGEGDDKVYTIEHLLSALNSLQIDNVAIDLDENEPPVMDGSALPFVTLLKNAGLQEQNAERSFFVVKEPLEYISNQTKIRLEPHNGFEIHCEVDYNHPMIRNQSFTLSDLGQYEKEIAPARTFCFDYEIEALKKKGLAKGGSLDNAIVVGPAGIYNPTGALRFQDEFVRHKVLDLMGDLMLLGRPIQGRVVAIRCGHGHNIKFLRQVLSVPASAPAALS